MTSAQDPSELFDLYDRDGNPLGRAKARSLVHRDGDWHRSIHIWVWGFVAGAPWLVLQRRSAAKDTHPRRLDMAVTGHVRAGESIEATLREAEEEIGLRLGPEDVVQIGRRRRPDRTRPGIIDNELQDIFVATKPVTIERLRPSPAELEAIVAVPLSQAERVFRDGGQAMGVRLLPENESTMGSFLPELVRGVDLVPISDGYYAKALPSVAAVMGGARPEAWMIG
ncbi:Putative Nudix hydrolase YfcD [Minicystis rosea]|nr:Putative Nudix hydrolase YfcD [Minicystis rosea]